MYGVVVTLIIIIAVLLILVVLAQNPKGGGLSGQFGGSGTSQLMGVKKTGDLLERLTWGFAIALLVLSISTSFIQSEPQSEGISSPNLENTQQQASPPAIQSAEGGTELDLLTEETPTDTAN